MDPTKEKWRVQLPFAVPFANPLEPNVLVINKATVQTGVRLIVIICTYLLFRPHLERLFRTMTGGQQDPQQQEIQERLQKIGAQKVTGGTGSGRKIAVAGAGSGTVPQTPSGNSSATGAGNQNTAKRRKA